MGEGKWTAMLPVELTDAEHDTLEIIMMSGSTPHINYIGLSLPASAEPISLQQLLDYPESGETELDIQALDLLIGSNFVARFGEDKFIVTEKGRLWWRYRELSDDDGELPKGLIGIVTSLKLSDLKLLRDQIEDILAQEDDEDDDDV